MVLLTSACGEKAPPPQPRVASAQGVLSAAWIYRPATPETLSATGLLEVEPGVTGEGPARVLIGQNGARLSAVLQGPAALNISLGGQTVLDALDAKMASVAMIYRVTDGNLCRADAKATHLIWYEPELVEGRTLTLAVVAGGAPGETGSTICRILRYTREREPSFEAAQ